MGTTPPLIATLLVDALDDLERSLDGLTGIEAERRCPGLNPICWTVAHLAQHIDSWVNGIMAGEPAEPFLSTDRFRRGSGGEPAEWGAAQAACTRVLHKARGYLARAAGTDLEQTSPYTGNVEWLKGKPIPGKYRLARLVAHVYYHVGDITAVRATMGHSASDFPSLLPVSLDALGRRPDKP